MTLNLFVFSIDGPKQNAGSLLTSVFLKHFVLFHRVPSVLLSMVALITTYFKESDWLLKNEEFPPIRKWLKKLPWRAKPRVPCERAYKTVSETAVKSDPAFCLGPTIEKTNIVLPFSILLMACLDFIKNAQ